MSKEYWEPTTKDRVFGAIDRVFAAITAIFLVSVSIALIGAGMLYHSWAVITIWNWFIPPLGASKISIGVALGLYLLASLMLPNGTNISCKIKNRSRSDIVLLLSEPLMIVGLAWLIKYLMM
jgi:hypothetical protein